MPTDATYMNPQFWSVDQCISANADAPVPVKTTMLSNRDVSSPNISIRLVSIALLPSTLYTSDEDLEFPLLFLSKNLSKLINLKCCFFPEH